MAYQVLARKYRPRAFDEIVGQPHVSTALRNAVVRERVSHAYLFAGPRGVGKTSTARILAKALNCADPSGGDPCGVCEACRAIDRGLFMDVFEIDAASNRGIDEVRDLREKVRYPPQHGRNKVYIVDEVHMLTDHAFNAFLKTLEEPPPHVVFIFATTEAHRIPQTILSRCQRYDFRRIRVKEIVGRLETVLTGEGYGAGELPAEIQPVLFAIGRKVDGSLRDALSLLDQALAFGDGTIRADALEGVLGRVGEELYLELTGILRERDAAGVFRFVGSLLDRGVDLDEFYYGFVDHIRSLILFRTGEEVGRDFEYPPHLVEACAEAAAAYTMEDLLRMARIVEREEYAFRTSQQRRFLLETLLLRLVMLDRTVSLNELLERGGGRPGGGPPPGRAAEPAAVGAPAQRTRPRSASTPAPAPVSAPSSGSGAKSAPSSGAGGGLLGAVSDGWSEITTRVKSRKISLGNFLASARPVAFEGGTLVLGVGDGLGDFLADQLGRASNLQLLFDVVSEVLGQRVSWSIEVRRLEGEGAAPGEPPPSELVEKVRKMFDAELIREEEEPMIQ